MAQRPLRSDRPNSEASVFLLSLSVLGAVLMGLLVLAACAGSDPQTSSVAGNSGAGEAPETEGRTAAGDTNSVAEIHEESATDAVDSGTDENKSFPDHIASAPVRLPAAKSAVAFDSERFDAREMSVARFRSVNIAQTAQWNTDRYDSIDEPGFLSVTDAPLSTFSIDVDTASYSNVRRFLIDGSRPPKGAVRIEEMLNYFRYPSQTKAGDHPFAVETEIFSAPWSKTNRLARITLIGREIPESEIPPRNLVFLIDVSGSMQGPDRLGLVKRGLTGLVEHLRKEDRVAIVVYAGASGIVLPPTRGDQRERILDALGFKRTQAECA